MGGMGFHLELGARPSRGAGDEVGGGGLQNGSLATEPRSAAACLASRSLNIFSPAGVNCARAMKSAGVWKKG